jgi:hypothetical protein
MASPFTGLLDQIGNGLLKPKGQMGDWQHAARTFVDDYFRLSPKAKFLYHVYFDINSSANFMPQFTARHTTELGMLVKNVDLPKFNIKTQTVNQYNRKKVVQLSHSFGPMTFRFHDDRSHILNMMWQAYYKYYYADSTTARDLLAYNRNAMSPFSYVRGAHGFDNNSSIPFFKRIILYQLNKREFVSYTLVNPMIQAFNHDTMTTSDQGTNGAECSMTVAFEAVTYDVGSISGGKVLGFAQNHYDTSPSPLSAAGGGTRSLLGTGGVLQGAADVIGAISDRTAFSSVGNIINTAATAVNTYQNAKGLTSAGLRQEGVGILTGAAIAAAGAGINALKGLTFPVPTNTTPATAKQVDIIPPGP